MRKSSTKEGIVIFVIGAIFGVVVGVMLGYQMCLNNLDTAKYEYIGGIN